MNLQDCLIPVEPNFGGSSFEQKRLTTEIVEVPDNPFYLPFKGDDRKHFELRIQHVGRYYLDDEVPEGETNEEINIDNYPLEFKMTTYGIPTLERFSEHLREEINNTLDAMGIFELNTYNGYYNGAELSIDRVDIQPQHIYKFLKNIHKDYTKTEDFLKDFDHYENRIYHIMKFVSSLALGKDYMFAQTFSGEIGMANIMKFLLK